MAEIKINRAPFLTLWASIVARRLGFDEEESLSLGRAISGLTAQSKGRRLGLFTPADPKDKAKVAVQREAIGAGAIEMMDRVIPCVRTDGGLRALSKASPVEPGSVRKYLAGRFKEALPEVESGLTQLANTYEPNELDRAAMDIYMRLRPNVPKGREGWGKAGLLDTAAIDRLLSERTAS